MSIGVIPTYEKPLKMLLPELAEDSLAIAQQAQVQTLVREKNLSQSINNTTQLVALEPPKIEKNSGDFYTTMTLALSRLAGVLGDMADGIIVELQFKRDEIKQLLKDKLETIAENEQRRKDAIAAKEAMEANKKRSGIFGSVMNFVFAGAEVLGGIAIIVGGALTANLGLIAGGVSLIAAGALEIAAEVITLTTGKEDVANRLSSAAIGFLVAGIVMSTYGAGAAAAAAITTKKAVKEGAEFGAETVVKQGGKKIAIETGEKVAKESVEKASDDALVAGYAVKDGGRVLSYGATISGVGNKGYKVYMAIQEKNYKYRAAEIEQEIAELGATLDAVMQEQEYVNKLIQLLQEQWTRAIAGPIEEAMKTLNESIKERAGVSRRIAASMGV